jgi:drug/metabolite transporter (DMT)-like permease
LSRGRGAEALVFLSLVVVWGTTWLAIRVGLEHYPPFFSLAVRFGLAGPVLLLLMFLRGEKIPWEAKYQPFFLALALLGYVLSYGVVYWAEQYVTSGMAAVIFGLMPLFTGVIAHFLLPSDRLTLWKVTGLFAGLSGIVIIHSADLAQLNPRAPLAALVIMVGPIATALSTILSKRRVQEFPVLALAGIPMLYGGIVQAILWLIFERGRPIAWSWPGVASIAYLTVFGSLITFSGYFWLLRRMEVSRVNLIAYLTPLVALGVGVLIGREPLPARVLLGALVVLAGVALANRRPRLSGSRPSAFPDTVDRTP